MEDIVAICKSDKPYNQLSKLNLFDKLIELTSFLDSEESINYYKSISYAQRIWHIKNQKFEIPICEFCGKFMNFNKTSSKGYTTHKECLYLKIEKSKKENNSVEKMIQTQIKNNLKKYGVKYYYQSDEFKEKSKQSSIEKYGTEFHQQSQSGKEKLRNVGKKNITERKTDIIEKINKTYNENNSQKHIDYMTEMMGKNNHLNQGYRIINYVGYKTYSVFCPKCKQNFDINSNLYYHRNKLNHEICTNCNPINKSYSSTEKELLDFISSIYSGKIIENDRNLINPYEIDIYLPELNLAIEYNGLIWHSDLYKPDNYHKIKSELCEKQGVKLIHVFEDDWNFKQDIIKSVLSNKISPQLNNKLFARKCEIKEVDFKNTNKFLEENHLLGKIPNFTASIGLYCNDELVSLMTFVEISKETKIVSLQRYAIKLNTTIVGGAEKLFKYFIRNHFEQFEYIKTLTDNDKFTGKIYERLGFKFVRRNNPNFMFVTRIEKQKIRITKQSIRKLKQGYKRENDPYPRIYNSGNDVYEFHK